MSTKPVLVQSDKMKSKKVKSLMLTKQSGMSKLSEMKPLKIVICRYFVGCRCHFEIRDRFPGRGMINLANCRKALFSF